MCMFLLYEILIYIRIGISIRSEIVSAAMQITSNNFGFDVPMEMNNQKMRCAYGFNRYGIHYDKENDILFEVYFE